MFPLSTLSLAHDVYIVNIFWYIFSMTDPYHHGNLRAELIAQGITMLNRDGIAAFSLRKLSQELGVSHAAAYRHFSSREDLFRAIFGEISQRFREALAASVALPDGSSDTAPDGSPETGRKGDSNRHRTLMRLGLGYVAFFRDNPEYVPLFSLMHSANPLLANVIPSAASKREGLPPCGGSGDSGRSGDSGDIGRDQGEAFAIFREVAAGIRNEEPYKKLEEFEILLGFWAKVHGLAMLLAAHPYMIPEGRFQESIERIMATPF